jgi:hypothetical protein
MALDSTPLRHFIGQGEIYTRVKKPDVGGAQLFVAADPGEPETGIPQVAGGTDAADYVGLTNGPASLEYKPEYKAVEIEQTYVEVEPRLVKESVTLKFKCALPTYQNLLLALQSATRLSVAGDGNTPNKEVLQVGGLIFSDPQTICLVSKIGSYTDTAMTPAPHNLFEWITLYQAMSVDGLKLDYKRGETRMVEVTFTGYGDVSRPDGDQLFQLGQDTDPTL